MSLEDRLGKSVWEAQLEQLKGTFRLDFLELKELKELKDMGQSLRPEKRVLLVIKVPCIGGP